MRLLWVLFLILVVVSGFLISPAGEALLVAMMFSVVAIPLAVPLMYVPATTVYFGLVLVPVTALRRMPRGRQRSSFAVFVLVAATVGVGIFALPTYLNSRMGPSLDLAVADDVDLSGAKAPGPVIALHRTRTKCDHLCIEIVTTYPHLRLVQGSYDQDISDLTVKPTSRSAVWGMVQKGDAACRNAAWNITPALYPALRQAEQDGYCLERFTPPARVDAVLRQTGAGAFGVERRNADVRMELFLRDGDQLKLAYRSTLGFRRKYEVPLVFLNADFGSGLDLDLSVKPRTVRVPLKSPVPKRTEIGLIGAVLHTAD